MQAKDFQQKTIDFAIRQLLSNNRYLVADEVGLGKTIIARGVIQELYKKKSAGKTLNIIYICSNQVLARQNLRKLAPLEDPENYSRLIFMVEQPETDLDFRISTLTPGISFKLTQSKGIVDERAILFRLLRATAFKKSSPLEIRRLDKLMRGDCGDKSWNAKKDQYLSDDYKMRDNIESLFLVEIKRSGLEKQIRQYLADTQTHREVDIIVGLRHAVTNIVLDHLIEADLFILDEFQRFQSLIETTTSDEEGLSEIAQTAKKVFDNPKHRVLLLSATPFTPYATQWDTESGDDHLESFDKVLKFLADTKQSTTFQDIKNGQKKYFESLTQRQANPAALVTEEQFLANKLKLEEAYLSLLSRTERAIVEKGSIINTNSVERIMAGKGELIRSVSAIRHLPQKQFSHLMVEFCKSVPHPYSFTTGYKIHADIQKAASKKLLPAELFLPLDEWESYRFQGRGSHSKLDVLFQKSMPKGIELKLWVPPSFRYYSANDDLAGYSKTLVFSAWSMVPRALSIYLSYEYERCLFEDSNIRYFPAENRQGVSETRKPLPLLTFTSDSGADSSMLSLLLYPCRLIATTRQITPDSTSPMEKILEELAHELRPDFSNFATSHGDKNQSYWYWYALFYLDAKYDVVDTKNFDGWLKGHWLLFDPEEDTSEAVESKPEKKRAKGKTLFLEHIADFLKTKPHKSSPRIPDDLISTIALASIASPAICAYRSLWREFGLRSSQNGKGMRNYSDSEYVECASLIALGFISLFNRPEAIQTIRKSIPSSRPYWHQCLEYCAREHIQAMLDEYVYMLAEEGHNMWDAAYEIFDTIRVKTNPLDATFVDTKHRAAVKRARCHFAVDFGRQNVSTSTGDERLVSVRDVFNSPFRPFVLTSTSVGQEGLDFHWYCKNVFHWNLPHNPIDIEQREGRVNRYMSHALRLNHASAYDSAHPVELRKHLRKKSLWIEIVNYVAAQHKASASQSCELVPYWHINSDAQIRIERIAPIYAFSADEERYLTFLKVLAVYRMTFGQPNQEQALSTILENVNGLDDSDLREFVRQICINLAPIQH